MTAEMRTRQAQRIKGTSEAELTTERDCWRNQLSRAALFWKIFQHRGGQGPDQTDSFRSRVPREVGPGSLNDFIVSELGKFCIWLSANNLCCLGEITLLTNTFSTPDKSFYVLMI